ncbi:SR-related and CTD-associated factor 4-like isoform X4 [Bolinopsis microptera]|uniref:SR-related and CTD-associated factor 4-like isoform X4 n=1 Tax=Bolinopsis microptera TaxID=2820187 RepID=UPI0030799B19
MTREMGSLPEPVKAFNDELAEMLTQKPPVSSSKMKDITRNAMKAQKYYKHIVMSVEKLVQKCKPEYKLSGIYVIDAIVRQSRHQNKEKDVYAGRFESNLHITATHLFKCSRTDQVKICRTFKLWELNKVFSYHSIQKCLNNANPEARKEGVGLAEKSIAKMAIKPVATPDIVKQQKELEEQRRKIKEQQEELKRKQEALLKQNSSSIPPILGKLLHFGQPKENAVPDDNVRASETANKVKSLLDDFDYSDEDDIKQPGKKGTPKSKSTPPPSIPTPKKTENLSTPSPVTTTHDTSLYQPDPPPKELSASKPVDKYDTRNLEKLYTPSPIDKPGKRSKHKSPERNKKSHKSEKRDSHSERPRDRSQDKSRDKSRERSRERSRDKSSRRRSSPEARRSSKSGGRSGKRSRSTSPGHYSRKRDRNSKPDCVSVLSTTIWIGNLRKTVTKSDISSLMKKYTESCSIDMVPPRGCSYINVNDRDVAENVLKELLKENLKLHGALCKVAWAPGKGCKEFKEHWNIEKGVTFIPHKNFEKLKISELEDGGVIEETTLPQGFKLQESEGAGTILEKLLVSMKETTRDNPSKDTPLGQFLSNGQENAYITKQEEQVSAKLDKLNDIAIPRSVSQESLSVKRDDDSIVHLLNSKDYALPMPENNEEGEDYYYPGMSPPVTLSIPKDIPQETPQVTSPVAEEPLPYSRAVEEPEESSQSEATLAESPMKLEKKAINLQTYLKRKKDDDPIEPTKEESPAHEEENLPPTPVKTPKHAEVDDDLLEWASQDAEEVVTKAATSVLNKAATPEVNRAATPELDKTLESEPGEENKTIKTPERMETSQEDGESQKEIEAKLAEIRSPSGSPIDSLLEEKLASPTAAATSIEESKEEGELESEQEKPGLVRLESLGSEKGSRSRSLSHSSKAKKDKKKKNKKKKKKDKVHDSDLEEDIRKLELLKAELEREERREKKEKEKRRQRKRSASPGRASNKDKKKKEKRQRR